MANRSINNTSSASLRRLFFGDEPTDNQEEQASTTVDVETAHNDIEVEEVSSKKGLKALFNDPSTENIVNSGEEEYTSEETIPSFLRKDTATTSTPKIEDTETNADTPSVSSDTKEEASSGEENRVDEATNKTFSSSDDITDVYKLNILTSEEIKEASFIGITENLLTSVFSTEDTYKKTLPLYAYGVTEEVMSSSQNHEIVLIDGKEFFSNTKAILDKESFERLVKEIELQIAIGKTYEKPLCQKHIVTVGNEFYAVPTLLVNTYEFNVLRKTFSSVAAVSLYVKNNTTYLKVAKL